MSATLLEDGCFGIDELDAVLLSQHQDKQRVLRLIEAQNAARRRYQRWQFLMSRRRRWL